MEKKPMNSELSEKNEILSLFKDYMYFMRQFFEIDDTDAWVSTAMSYLDSYATETDRHIFALKNAGVPIGFAMLNNYLRFNKEGFAIAEFYIDTQHQANGLGRELAEYVFDQFPGHWEIAVTRGNDNAEKFWRRSISDYTSGEYREWKIDTYDGSGFSFFNA